MVNEQIITLQENLGEFSPLKHSIIVNQVKSYTLCLQTLPVSDIYIFVFYISLIICELLVLKRKICLGLLCYSYEMLPLEEQLEIANQIGTTRSQILSNLSDLSLGTSFL